MKSIRDAARKGAKEKVAAYKNGGRAKGKTNINIVIAPQAPAPAGGERPPAPPVAPVPVPMPPAGGPPVPPMLGGAPPVMRKRGGRV